jgi:hypothetical protein
VCQGNTSRITCVEKQTDGGMTYPNGNSWVRELLSRAGARRMAKQLQVFSREWWLGHSKQLLGTPYSLWDYAERDDNTCWSLKNREREELTLLRGREKSLKGLQDIQEGGEGLRGAGLGDED